MFLHISANPSILGGKPCIRGTRISVEMILEWMASGASIDDIVRNYPHLPKEAVIEAVQYAAGYLNNEVLIEVTSDKK